MNCMSDATATPTKEKLTVKVFSWTADTVEELTACKRLGRHETDTATVKAALAVYRQHLEFEAARARVAK